MDNIEELTKYFKEFPGIGERQAKRFVYFLLHKNPSYVKEFGEKILSLKNLIKQCPSCFLFFQGKTNAFCQTCSDIKTDHTSLLIVEKDADFENIKRSNTYKGMYFILGGLIPIVTKDTPKFIRINELLRIVEERSKTNDTKSKLKEIIIALSLNPQGEHTDEYIKEILSSLKNKYNFNIVSMGRGLSTGTELEYSDSDTIKNAFKNRT